MLSVPRFAPRRKSVDRGFHVLSVSRKAAAAVQHSMQAVAGSRDFATLGSLNASSRSDPKLLLVLWRREEEKKEEDEGWKSEALRDFCRRVRPSFLCSFSTSRVCTRV